MQPQTKAPPPPDANKPKATKGGDSLIEVNRFDMTEEEVRLWDTRVGMAVGLLVLIAAGSALVFGTIKLINWLNN